MKKWLVFICSVILVTCLCYPQLMRLALAPETLLPLSLIEDIINEASGDLALQNEIFLSAVNRNRLPEEYLKGYFESEFIRNKCKEYGIEAEIIDLPTRAEKTWDAEAAELWILKPEKKKIADLKEIPACLCSGSSSADVTAELVYVGPGNNPGFYQGKEVKDKIVLVNGTPEMARRLAVEKFEAKGLVGFASSHPEFDPDQVGWSSIRPTEKEKPTFAFMISTRLGQSLQDMIERGTKVEVRVVCKTQTVPYKEEMVSAFLPGKEFPEEELVFVAHLFEGFAKQGANDNVSGCVAILETARVIKKLVDDGKIPPLKRSIRFLFVPEISGTIAYLKKYPEIAKRFFACINEDMVGEGLMKNNAYFVLIKTPYSLPTYLNDVTEALVEWVGTTQRQGTEYRGRVVPIVSPTGTKDPFYYAVDRYSGGSDHIVFNDGGVRIPAVFFNVWPDMWYHTSGDLPDKSDSTQLKRAVFLSTASAVFLASAGSEEALKMIAETSARGLQRIGLEKLRAEKMIREADKKDIHTPYKEAANVVTQAVIRESEALSSIRFFIKNDQALENHLRARTNWLTGLKNPCLQDVEEAYRLRCLKENTKPQKLSLTADELRLSKLVPVRTEEMRGYFDFMTFGEKLRNIKDRPPYSLGRAESEVRNFIDGKKSILEIRNSVSAELEPVKLQDVENYILVLEKAGFVTIQKK